MRRPLAAAALVVVVATMTTACGSAGPGPADARARLSADDRLEAAAPASAFAPVADGDILPRNTRLRALAGEPELDLRGGGRVALRPNAVVAVSQPLYLDSGELLVTATRAVDVSTAMTDVRVSGIARVGQSLASSVRVYRGTATVSSSGRALVVGSLRQTAVPALGFVNKRATPTTWRADDAWDTRYLRTVIALTDALEAQGRGFAMQASGATPVDIASLLPGVDGRSLVELAARRSAGDTLVGGAIASAGSSPLDTVFGLRDTGAAWGIVAVERAGGDEYRAVLLVRRAIAAWLRLHAGTGPAWPSVSAPTGSLSGAPSMAGTSPSTGGATSPTTTAPSPSTTGPPTTIGPITVPTLPPVTVPSTTLPQITTTTTIVLDDAVDTLIGDD